MSSFVNMLYHGAGTMIGLLVFLAAVWVLISDITQKKHAILRNFPLVGHLRYLFERQGEYLRNANAW